VSRLRGGRLAGLAVLALFSVPLAAQQGPVINPRIPPPPPPAEPSPPPAEKPAPPQRVAAPPPAQPAAESQPVAAQPVAPRKIEPPLPRVVPATVVLPAGTVRVVLDTPMSTRISRNGQQVVFRTERDIPLEGADSLALPPETAFMGTVVKVRRPGSFGKQGEIRVEVRRLQLSTGQTTPVEARLNSADPDYSGKGGSDRSRAANIINMAIWTAQGTVLGAQIHGGSGAAVGAGAGVLVGLIILASHHGQDVYLEPGMPFEVVLEQPVTLSGPAVLAAEENYRNAQPAAAGGSSVASNAGPITPGGNSTSAAAGSSPSKTTSDDDGLPRLKRRPPASSPQP
jgi:hypothetical protein